MRSIARLLAGAGREQLSSEPRGPLPKEGPIDGIPAWAVSSGMEFLSPFWTNQGLVDGSFYGGGSFGDVHRDFLREVERNLRIPLDWRNGSASASRSLGSAMA